MMMIIGLILCSICLAGLNLIGANFPWEIVVAPAILAGFFIFLLSIVALAQDGNFLDNLREA